MKRAKKDKATSAKKRSKHTEEVVERMVLRSRKKCETSCNKPTNINSSILQNGMSSDVSDCVIICEKLAKPNKNADKQPKLITSTPIRNLRSKISKFDDSCGNVAGTGKNVSLNNDVIVLSDSSKSNIQIIEINDDCSSSNNDIKVQHHSEKLQENELKNEIILENNDVNFFAKKPKFHHNTERVLLDSFFKRKRRKDHKHAKKNRNDKWIFKANVPKLKVNTQFSNVGENIYIEEPIVLPKTGLRPIIIDGSNVAFHHSNNSYFSCKGLEICIKYFKQRGHEVTAFVPQFRMQSNKSDNPKLLDQLVKNGDVILTPSRIIDGNPIVSYDDRYIVQTAVLKGGIIVSRDNYKDLLMENPAWSETINYRLLQFTWVKDLLIFPRDPLGEKGPTLQEFLKFG